VIQLGYTVSVFYKITPKLLLFFGVFFAIDYFNPRSEPGGEFTQTVEGIGAVCFLIGYLAIKYKLPKK
jgi:hypothetical protein